jgi:hypothetical protein
MSETWHILYLRVDSQEQVVTGLKRLMASKENVVAPGLPSAQSGSLLALPMFYFWISPVIQGWVSVCRDFPPLTVTVKEIADALDCLAFECWIGEGNWGYLLYEGKSIIDRFDSNPRQTMLYEYLFSERWERDSPYAALESGELAVEKTEEVFGGHPERLTLLPLSTGTTPGQLGAIMDSEALFQTDIVDRFAGHVNLPNFVPQLLDPSYIQTGLQYLFSSAPLDTNARKMVESIERLDKFVSVVFRPASVDKYHKWLQSLPSLARPSCLYAAINWYEWYLAAASPNTLDRLAANRELDALRALWDERY